MASITPQLLSGSTDGKPVPVSGTTSGTANTVHVAVGGTTSFDEVWLWACNQDTATRKLTVEHGAAGAANELSIDLPAGSGPVLVLAGPRLNNGAVLKTYADVANTVNVIGNVNRYVP